MFGKDRKFWAVGDGGDPTSKHRQDREVGGFILKVFDEGSSFEESGGPERGGESKFLTNFTDVRVAKVWEIRNLKAKWV